MSVVGIDFGTLNCVISQAKRGGIDTVLNEGSKRQTAALVSFQGKQRFMGVAAGPLVRSNYKNTIVEVKRFVGRSWSDPQVQSDIARCPNAKFFKELEGDRIGIEVSYMDTKQVFTPEDLCAMLMSSLKNTAEFANEGRKVSDIVFSVPAFWTDRQRRAFLNAAKIANMDVLGLINDGTAAALSYGIWKSASNQFDAKEAEHVMFVDMGYASYQVTIAAFVQGKLQIVASACDANLGGRDLDWALAKHFAAEFEAKHKKNPLDDPKAMIKLLGACEKLKQTMTPEGVNTANIQVEYLMDEIDFASKLTLEQFNDILEPFLERITEPLERAMVDSGLSMDKISSVEIIGGSTRVRGIKKHISTVLELDQEKANYGLATTQNADECISRGCALRCAILSPAFRVKDFLVSDTVAFPITLTWEQREVVDEAEPDAMDTAEDGAEAGGKNSIVIFAKGCETPKTRRVTFRRNEAFDIAAAYDESVAGSVREEEMSIGSFRISGMPSAQSPDEAPPRIRVDFRQDEYGLFNVASAKYMEEIVPKEEAPKDEAKQSDEGKDEGAAEEGAEEAAKQEEKGSEAKKDDAEAGQGEEEAPKPKPKKKTFKAVTLQVEATINSAMTESEVLNARQREEQFVSQDRILRETGEKRNELEEFVYSMRDKVDLELKEYGTEEEKAALKAALQSAEDWLYNEGYDETKAVYQDKLSELQGVARVLVSRATEATARPTASQELLDEVAKYLKVVNSPDEKYDHIEDEERETVRKACKEAEDWLQAQSNLQAEKNLFEDPVFTVADIKSKMYDLNGACRSIVNKKRPAPKKEEKKPDAEAEATPMDADGDEGEGQSQEEGDGPKEAKEEGDGEEKAAPDMDVD
ncbi:97 kDa heat shock protein (Heat shock protein 110) [Durusdinium trenchii]|uniref:97 kDa heat shock protein (Heat shock protein 110) n=1 Tax=Durusdinium trenchii TaxID=1381693 RepID=A0ABP0JYQ4_9DINO